MPRSLAQGAGNNGQPLDLLIGVSASATSYSLGGNIVNAAGAAGYVNPTRFQQALLTQLGYACVGAGISKSVCESGASLDPVTGDCTDGTPVTIQGACSC